MSLTCHEEIGLVAEDASDFQIIYDMSRHGLVCRKTCPQQLVRVELAEFGERHARHHRNKLRGCRACRACPRGCHEDAMRMLRGNYSRGI